MTRLKHPLDHLRDRSVVVTGASSGIGLACCNQLAAYGVKVIGMDLSLPESTKASDFVSFDQGDFDSIEHAVEQLPSDLAGLLNIAGVAPGPKFDPAAVLRINFFGVRHLTRRVAHKLSEGAAVINMGSGAGAGWMSNLELVRVLLALDSPSELETVIQSYNVGNQGTGNNAAYPVSKQLLAAWTMQAVLEFRDAGVRINTVAPAAVDTPILKDFLDSFGAESAQRISAFGAASADSVAAAAILLLGADAVRINGAILPVDAGAIAAGTSTKLGL